MTQSLQMFWSFRVFLRVCDHLQSRRYVMLPLLQPQLRVSSNAALHQSSDQARANNESGRPRHLALVFLYHISLRVHVNQTVWRLFLECSVSRVWIFNRLHSFFFFCLLSNGSFSSVYFKQTTLLRLETKCSTSCALEDFSGLHTPDAWMMNMHKNRGHTIWHKLIFLITDSAVRIWSRNKFATICNTTLLFAALFIRTSQDWWSKQSEVLTGKDVINQGYVYIHLWPTMGEEIRLVRGKIGPCIKTDYECDTNRPYVNSCLCVHTVLVVNIHSYTDLVAGVSKLQLALGFGPCWVTSDVDGEWQNRHLFSLPCRRLLL